MKKVAINTMSSLAIVEKKRIISLEINVLKILYVDYHSWTDITTDFQYHFRSFDIRNASYKKSRSISPGLLILVCLFS